MNVVKDLSFLDMVLLMAPIGALTLLAMFRMDERVSNQPVRVVNRHKFCEVDGKGRGVLSDPDGKLLIGRGLLPVRGNERQRSSRKPLLVSAEVAKSASEFLVT